jgi:hypothetical protein
MDCGAEGRGRLWARELLIGAGCELNGGGLCETGGFGAGRDDEELCDGGGEELRLESSTTLTAARLTVEQAIPKTTRLNPSRCLMATIPCPAGSGGY